MNQQKSNENLAKTTITWNKQQVISSMSNRFIALLFATIIELNLNLNLSQVKDFLQTQLSNETVRYFGKGYWETRRTKRFANVMKKLGINWDKQFVSTKDIQELAKIPWVKMLLNK
jgi:hypothetical protein